MTRLTRFILALGLALFPAAGFAQDSETTADVANRTAFGDWVVICDAVTVKKTACRLVQEQTLRDTGELVARFVAMPVADGVILLAQLPMGVYLPGGAVYRIEGKDDVAQNEMIWQRCAGTICEAAAPISEEELAVFAEAEALLFGFRMTAQGEPVILRVDISQFAEAVAMIRAPQ